MDHLLFMNSKTLFKVRPLVHANVGTSPSRCVWPSQFQRKDPGGKNRLPVMVHINYHPDKVRAPAADPAVSLSPDGSFPVRRSGIA